MRCVTVKILFGTSHFDHAISYLVFYRLFTTLYIHNEDDCSFIDAIKKHPSGLTCKLRYLSATKLESSLHC